MSNDGTKLAGQLMGLLAQTGARQATKYVSGKSIVRVTRRRSRGKLVTGRGGSIELTVTIGRPNHKERKFIRAYQKAGKTFPVRKPRLTFIKGHRAQT